MDENENLFDFEIPECHMRCHSFQSYRDPGDLTDETRGKSIEASVLDEFLLNSDSNSSIHAEKDTNSSESVENFFLVAQEKEKGVLTDYDIRKNCNFYLQNQKRTSFECSLADLQAFEERSVKRICTGINKDKSKLDCKVEIEKQESESKDLMKERPVEGDVSPELLAGACNWNPSLHVDATGKQSDLTDEMKKTKGSLKRQLESSPTVFDDYNIDIMKKLKIEESPDEDNLSRTHGN